MSLQARSRDRERREALNFVMSAVSALLNWTVAEKTYLNCRFQLARGGCSAGRAPVAGHPAGEGVVAVDDVDGGAGVPRWSARGCPEGLLHGGVGGRRGDREGGSWCGGSEFAGAVSSIRSLGTREPLRGVARPDRHPVGFDRGKESDQHETEDSCHDVADQADAETQRELGVSGGQGERGWSGGGSGRSWGSAGRASIAAGSAALSHNRLQELLEGGGWIVRETRSGWDDEVGEAVGVPGLDDGL